LKNVSKFTPYESILTIHELMPVRMSIKVEICKKKSMKNFITTLFFLAGSSLFSQNYTWAKNISGSGNEICYSMSKDATGNIYVAGSFEGSTDFNPSPNQNDTKTSAGSKDIFMAKYDNLGSHQWSIRMGGSGVDEAKFIKINPSNNDIYLVGTFQNVVDFDFGSPTATLSSAGGYDIFFARYSSTGTLLYARRIGGVNIELVDAVDINSSGDLIMLGRFTGTVDFNPNSGVYNLVANGSEAFIAQYSNNFTLLQAYKFGPGSVYPKDVCYDNTGTKFYVTGGFNGTFDADFGSATQNLSSVSGNNDAFVVKYDNAISLQWAVSLSGTTGAKEGKSICIDANNNALITGAYAGTMDVDPSSNVVSYTSNTNSMDAFFAAYGSTSGTYLGSHTIGGSGNDYGNCISVDASSNIYISGAFQSTIDLDPTNGTDVHTSGGGDDVFFYKMSNNLTYSFGKSLSGGGHQQVLDQLITGSDGLNICGLFTNAVDFDPNSGVAQITAIGQNDGYFARYEACAAPTLPTSAATNNMPCAGESITLSVVSGDLGGGANYVWYAGGCGNVSVGTGTTIVLNPTISTGYFVRAEGGCLTSPGPCSGANSVDVIPTPTLSLSSNQYTICQGEYATLSFSGASSYSLNGGPLNSSTISLNPFSSSVYTISGANICVSTKTIAITVDACTGLPDELKSKVKFFPSPATDLIQIECNTAIKEVTIKDLTGKTLRIEQNNLLDVKDLASGVYIMEVYHLEGMTVARVVIAR